MSKLLLGSPGSSATKPGCAGDKHNSYAVYWIPYQLDIRDNDQVSIGLYSAGRSLVIMHYLVLGSRPDSISPLATITIYV